MDQDTQRFQTDDRHAGDPAVVHLGPFAQPAAGVPAPALHLQRHVLLVDRPARRPSSASAWRWRTSTTSPTTTAPACGSSTPTGRSTRPTATTWPTRFTLGSGPATRNYQNIEWGFFAQDDLRLGNVTLNLGLRYDFDSNLRSPDLIADLLADPQFAGLENMVTADRGNDLNNLQPRLGFAWDVRGDGGTVAARRPGPLLGPEPAVVQHPRRRREQPVHRRGDRSQPAAVLSRPDGRARRPHAGGLHPHRRRPGASTCRATTSACPTSSAPRSASPRCCRATPRWRSTSSTRTQKDLQTGRDANLPARRTDRQQPAAVPAVLVGHADQLADQFELRRAAGPAAPPLPRHQLAGVLHLRQGDLRQHQRQRQHQHRPLEHVRQRRPRASTRTTAATPSRCR